MPSSVTLYLVFCCAFIILVWGALVPFRAGLLYNGTVYCMAVGGYFGAFAATELNLPFWLCILGAAIVGAILGFLPALGFSRTSGVVTAVASMALIFIIQSVIRNLDFLGGTRGIRGIPKVEHLLLYSVILVVVLGAFLYRLNHSKLGRALEAINTDADMATTLGINVKRMTVFSLTVSSIFGAVAGVLYAFNMRTIYPETFGFSLLLSVMTMLFVGGRYTQWGVFISVPLIQGLPQWVPPSINSFTQIIYGVILVVILMARPEGIITRELPSKIKRLFRKSAPTKGQAG